MNDPFDELTDALRTFGARIATIRRELGEDKKHDAHEIVAELADLPEHATVYKLNLLINRAAGYMRRYESTPPGSPAIPDTLARRSIQGNCDILLL